MDQITIMPLEMFMDTYREYRLVISNPTYFHVKLLSDTINDGITYKGTKTLEMFMDTYRYRLVISNPSYMSR